MLSLVHMKLIAWSGIKIISVIWNKKQWNSIKEETTSHNHIIANMQMCKYKKRAPVFILFVNCGNVIKVSTFSLTIIIAYI